MNQRSDFYKWQEALKKAYLFLLKQKKRTVCETAFIARFEGRVPAGALSKSLQERIRD